jgi:hypothetical protein
VNGTPVAVGHDWSPTVSGNFNGVVTVGSLPPEAQATVGIGGMIFVGVHAGFTFGGSAPQK